MESGGESCCTDYETDGFWSSEQTLLESVRGGGTSGQAATAVRRRKKKKKAKDRGDGRKKEPVTTGRGLAQQWRSFLLEHEDEWRDSWRLGRKCIMNTVSGITGREFIVSDCSEERRIGFYTFFSFFSVTDDFFFFFDKSAKSARTLTFFYSFPREFFCKTDSEILRFRTKSKKDTAEKICLNSHFNMRHTLEFNKIKKNWGKGFYGFRRSHRTNKQIQNYFSELCSESIFVRNRR